jgi:hypothetical protein
MAIVSDGTTDITILDADENLKSTLERASKRTGGGNVRSITGGERIVSTIKGRVTPANYRLLIDLQKNGASNYFYTPNDSSEWSDLFPTDTWPLNCNIFNLESPWNNRSYYYIEFEMESVSYV